MLTFFSDLKWIYFFSVDGCAGAAGALFTGAAGASPLIVLDTEEEVEVPLEGVVVYAPEMMQSANKEIASVQVAFSRKSAVLRTPITWLEEEKEDANPPPLEF